MFCRRCGFKLAENAKFCENCGTSVVDEQTSHSQYDPKQQQANQTTWKYQNNTAAPVQNSTGSSTFPILFFLVIVGCVIAGLFALVSLWDDSWDMDYIAFVKSAEPTTISDVTYEELMDHYLQHPIWKEREGENGVVYVDITGTMNGGNEEIKLTIRCEPTDDPEFFLYSPHRIMIDGSGREGSEFAEEFVSELCVDYEYGDGTYDLIEFLDFLALFS